MLEERHGDLSASVTVRASVSSRSLNVGWVEQLLFADVELSLGERCLRSVDA
jgi:hypothetical protein